MNFVVTNRKFRGSLTEESTAIVMDNTYSRKTPGKVQVSYFITKNIDLLAGNNTVAVFKLIPRPKPVVVTLVEKFDFKQHFTK